LYVLNVDLELMLRIANGLRRVTIEAHQRV
jgi:hypothetical protein